MAECSSSSFIVRAATPDDMPEVRDMIQELADFEKMSDGPKLSAEDLIQDAGLKDQKPLPEGKSYFLEDIYVRPEYRKCGIGRSIFKYVAAMAKQFNCPRLDFHVLDWNPACQFYESLGAINLTSKEGWQFYRMGKTQIDQVLKE